jgi:hypothetical protein
LTLFLSVLRGEMAQFDIVDNDGKTIVEQGKRINARHVRQMEAAGLKSFLCLMSTCTSVFWQKTSHLKMVIVIAAIPCSAMKLW